jgi:hypothetical protein
VDRINLNVPEGVRARIKALAKVRGQTEGEAVRELVMSALRQAERQKEIESIQREQTPERQARLLELAHAVETLRAPAPPTRRRGISR